MYLAKGGSRFLHLSLCSLYHRPPLDPIQLHTKNNVLLIGFISVLSINLYLYYRSGILCRQYDTFLMRKLRLSEFADVGFERFDVHFGRRIQFEGELSPLPSYLYHEHGY